MRNRELIYLALGTNIGDREKHLQTAKTSMCPRVTILQESPIYITPPWGYLDQPDFLNQVIAVTTRMRPRRLLQYLNGIEKAMGRQTLFRNGPRVIDLDILFYGQRVINTDDLKIPHPRMADRAFVLVPLNDIAPYFVHPVLEIRIKDMLTGIDTTGVKPL